MCFVFQTQNRKLCYTTSFRDLKKEQSIWKYCYVYRSSKNIFQYLKKKISCGKKKYMYRERENLLQHTLSPNRSQIFFSCCNSVPYKPIPIICTSKNIEPRKSKYVPIASRDLMVQFYNWLVRKKYLSSVIILLLGKGDPKHLYFPCQQLDPF